MHEKAIEILESAKRIYEANQRVPSGSPAEVIEKERERKTLKDIQDSLEVLRRAP